MNALIAIFTWMLGLLGPTTESPVMIREHGKTLVKPTVADSRGVTIVSVNPRTVIALEDTHFRPNR